MSSRIAPFRSLVQGGVSNPDPSPAQKKIIALSGYTLSNKFIRDEDDYADVTDDMQYMKDKKHHELGSYKNDKNI